MSFIGESKENIKEIGEILKNRFLSKLFYLE